MVINGKVHCFFEQSGTFKRAFRCLGIPAYDYDIENSFGETDHLIDLFAEIEKAYLGGSSVFDNVSNEDLIIAFFPCIHFCDAKTLFFRCQSKSQKNWSLSRCMAYNIEFSRLRESFFVLLLKLVAVVDRKKIRFILENPYNPSGMTYLENNFMPPTIIDKNRRRRGDYFVKPTGYWFINCQPTCCCTFQRCKILRTVDKSARSPVKGLCSLGRSILSPDYARNFISDFILGMPSSCGCLQQGDLFAIA